MKLNSLTITCLLIFGITFLPTCNTSTTEQSISIKIGKQEWMTKNLDISTFRNGDSIPEIKNTEEWQKASKQGMPAWCYYENDPNKGFKSGRLYNWFAINDPRGLAPEGWHIPSRQEWKVIENKIVENNILFSENHGGFRHMNGNYRMYGIVGYWGSFTETESKNTSWIYQFSNNVLKESNAGKGTGFSIKCIRDKKKKLN